jgi:hypothetical protein
MKKNVSVRLCACASFLLLLSSGGCGTTMELQPLIGEDAEQLALLETTEEALTIDAPTAAAQTLLGTLERNKFERAWPLLSSRTQDALVRKFSSTSAPGSGGLLKEVKEQLKREKGHSLIQILFGTTPESLRSYGPDQERTHPPGRAPSGEATVFAYGSNGQVARVHFILHQRRWLLDTTQF